MAYIRRTRKKLCKLCQSHVEYIDYKNVDLIQNYINPVGKILPRRASGACAGHQRKIANAVKRARYIAILPYIKAD